MSRFRKYASNKLSLPAVPQGTVQPPSYPVIDGSNAIGSLAGLLGPTPAEREERERRMRVSKAKTAAWTGLFDGLRQLGNLYYTAQGATPQQYTSPYQQIEQDYEADRQRANELDNYRRQYAQQLYALQRQGVQDKMAQETHAAQLEYYKNRDALNARKIEIQAFNAQVNADYKQASLEQKEEMLEIRRKLADGEITYKEAQTQLAKVKAANGGFAPQRPVQEKETTVTKTDDRGKTTTTVTRTGPVRRSSRGLGWGNNIEDQETDW